MLDLDLLPKASPLDVAPGPFEHDRRDVDCGHAGSEPTSHLNSRGPDAAADIECPLPRLQARQVKVLLRRATATGMDYALAEYRHKRIWIQRLDIDFGTGQRGCHLTTSFHR